MATWVKEPASLLEWVVSWATWLGTSETITSHTVTTETGITLDSSSATDDAITVWLAGGTLGETYTITVQVSTSGGRTDVRSFTVAVRDLETLNRVKDRLGKQLSVDDGEVQDMIDAAEAEYAELIGPVSGEVTEVFDGGGTTLVLRQPVNAITAAAYDNGSDLTYTDLVVSNGIVRWGYGTAGRFRYGRVSITYDAPVLPANHREAIVADVAGYFETTQRGGGSLQPSFPGEGEYEAAYAATPAVLFPRIQALAKRQPVIA